MTYLVKSLSVREGIVCIEVETAPDYAGYVAHSMIELSKPMLEQLKELLLEP